MKIIQTNDRNLLRDTLYQMYLLENKVLKDPIFKAFCDNRFSKYKRNIRKLLFNLWEFVHFNFKYQDDPYDELLISPAVMLGKRTGDCDDFALFIKSVLNCLGYPCEYVLMGTQLKTYTHIAVKCKGFILDATLPKFNYLNTERYNYFYIPVPVNSEKFIKF